MSTYHVDYRRDGAVWIATVRGVRGCHTFGPTLDAAKRRIREALSLFVDDAKTADLKHHPHFPPQVRRLLARFRASLRDAQKAEQVKTLTAQQLIRLLTETSLKLSTRDTAALLDLSHQRVHQLKHSA
jgi:predicted RNase H-like HicB family nuclease